MEARMVNISRKKEQYRQATAVGKIKLRPETIKRIREHSIEKGDPLQIARLAGIQSTKMTHLLIPLCHPLRLQGADVSLKLEKDGVSAKATVIAVEKTGVEMEALTAVSVALLNVLDVVKKYEKDENGQYPSTVITDIRVVEKVKR